MRIAFVMHGFQPGQKQMQFLNYARCLPDDVQILMLFIRPVDAADELCSQFRDAGTQVRSLNCRLDLSPVSVLKTLGAFRDFAPDIIHSQHAVGGVNAKIAGALYRRQNPGVRIICEQRNARKGLSRLGRALDPATFRFADLVLSSSTGVEESYFGDALVLDAGSLADGTFDPVERKHYTFHNSIDITLFGRPSAPERHQVRSQLGLSHDTFLFLMVGRFSPQKAYDVLINAVARLPRDADQIPDFRLLCVGDGPLQTGIKALAQGLLVSDRVIFTGYRSDIDQLYRAADCFLLPSRWEGLPKVLLEAMAVGLPSIVSDVEGNHDVLADTDAGILVPPDDIDSLAAAMLRLLTAPDALQALRTAALERVQDFSVLGKTRELYRVYELLLHGPDLLTEAQRYLVASATAGIALQAIDGTMPAGRNGAWDQAETPVRTTAHWAITFLAAYRITSQDRFRAAAQRALDALLQPGFRPNGQAWHCLGDGSSANDGNGLIGQAWVMEAFLHAFQTLDRRDLLQLAVELYRLHRQDRRTGLYQVLGVDGTHHLPDATFNHQLWFAAISARVLNAAGLDAHAEGCGLFAGKLLRILHRNRRYVVEQKIHNRLHGSLKGYLRQAASNAYHRVVTRSLKVRSVGYLTFTLHGVAMLKEALPDHPVWTSSAFTRLVSHARRYMNRPEFFDDCVANRFAFPHNITAAELAYLGRVFSIPVPARRFWVHQFSVHWDERSGLLDQATDDPAALAARLYELVYLL